jgi:hypothetical protein
VRRVAGDPRNTGAGRGILKQQSRGAVGLEGRRGLLVGKILVGAQMAFCLLLLVVAGLFARSLRSLTQTDVGFDKEHVLAARVDVRGAGYTSDERQALYRRVVERLQAIPGVQSASFSANGPLANSARISSMSVEGHTESPGERMRTNEEIVTDRYFETVGLKVIDGRPFGPEDRKPGSLKTIINATMAKRFFPGTNPIGRRYRTQLGDSAGPPFEIIGVAGTDARIRRATAPPNMAITLPRHPPTTSCPTSRCDDGAPGLLAHRARNADAVRAAAPDRRGRPAGRPDRARRLQTDGGAPHLDLRRAGTPAREPRPLRTISQASAGGLLSLACGWRSADRSTVLWMVLREALTLVVAGGLVGLLLAFVAGKAMGTLPSAGPPTQPRLVLSVSLLVVAPWQRVAAHRASRIEPMLALGRAPKAATGEININDLVLRAP